jgi:alcohol dehydrogenase
VPVTRDVWRIDRAGSLERLTRRSEPLPDLAAGQARVAVKAVGLNFADIFACLGLYSATPRGSFIPGLEFAGIVEDVNPGAGASFRPGDRVAGLTRFGAYATAINADVAYLRPIRAGWSFEEAAAFPAQALTAWYGLIRLGAVERGDVVLVQSAAGGVGLNALAILNAFRARPIAVVGRDAKRHWLIENRALAADQVIVRDRRSFGAQLDRALAALGARGFDIVFDAVAGPFLRPAFRRLRPAGRYVLYGAADFMPAATRPGYLRLAWKHVSRPRIDPLAMISANRSMMAFNLIWLWDRLDQLAAGWNELNALGTTRPLVWRRFPFDEAPAAMRYLQSGESIGKVVLDA